MQPRCTRLQSLGSRRQFGHHHHADHRGRGHLRPANGNAVFSPAFEKFTPHPSGVASRYPGAGRPWQVPRCAGALPLGIAFHAPDRPGARAVLRRYTVFRRLRTPVRRTPAQMHASLDQLSRICRMTPSVLRPWCHTVNPAICAGRGTHQRAGSMRAAMQRAKSARPPTLPSRPGRGCQPFLRTARSAQQSAKPRHFDTCHRAA